MPDSQAGKPSEQYRQQDMFDESKRTDVNHHPLLLVAIITA